MRKRFTEFTTTEQSGTTFVTAKPASSADEPVRFDAGIAERGSSDELEANWEEIISTLAQSHLGEKLTINKGRGVMDRDEAIQALVESDSDHVKSEHASHAVIEYLAEKDIVTLEDDEVVLLMTYDDIRENGASAMLNNWAAMLDTCIERIDSAVERVEKNRETLEKHVENLEETASVRDDYAEKMQELQQEMKAMLGGRKPSELDEEERQRFQRKRARYHRYEAMEESIEGGAGAGHMNAPQMLSNLKEELIDLKGALSEHSKEFRTIALYDDLEQDGAREMVENLTDVIAQIGDAMEPKERMEEMSDDEFMDDVLDVTDTVAETELDTETSVETVDERR